MDDENIYLNCTLCGERITDTARVEAAGFFHPQCLDREKRPDLEARARVVLLDNLGTTTLTVDRFDQVVKALAEEFSK